MARIRKIMPKLMNPLHQMGIMNEHILPTFQYFDAGRIHRRAGHFGSGFHLKGVFPSKGSKGILVMVKSLGTDNQMIVPGNRLGCSESIL